MRATHSISRNCKLVLTLGVKRYVPVKYYEAFVPCYIVVRVCEDNWRRAGESNDMIIAGSGGESD